MALQPCAECGAKISDQAPSCPQCGAKPKPKTSKFTMLVGGFFAIGVAMAVLSPKKEVPEAPPKTPAEQAAETQKELRFQKTVLVAKIIKASLREPDSVKWASIGANDDASVVCIEYRARNGFGGMNLERASYAKGKLSTEADTWNARCTGKSMYDMAYVAHAL